MSNRILRSAAVAALVLFAVGAKIASADSLLLRSGTLISGHLPTPTYTLQTSSGELEIPRSSIRTITFSPTTVEITLRDHTTVTGTLALATVELQQPMMLRRVPVADVREILFTEDAPNAAPSPEAAAAKAPSLATTLDAGAPIALELARTLSSAGPLRAGTTVPLCVAADVMVGGKVAIPAGRVAVGELAVVDPARAGNREGRLVLELERTWAANGVEVPLRGQVAFEGRFNAGNVAALGAVGLLATGGQATANTGTAVTATLARALGVEDTLASGGEIGSAAPPWPAELQARCDLYRRFRQPEGWVRVDEVPKDLDLAPLRSPMRLEFAVPKLAALARGESWQGMLVRRFACEDVRFAALGLTAVRSAKGKAAFDFSGMLTVEPSYDRWVDVRLELISGAGTAAEQTLASAAIAHVDAEEGKTTTLGARLVADRAAVEAAVAPVLRVTVYVTAND